MARGLRGHGGGIASLRELIRRHKEAVEYDLIALGLRLDWLGTEALSWRDLLVIVRQSPSMSAISRALRPEESAWGLSEHLQAMTFDVLQQIAWLQSEDGMKGRNRPTPLPRPGAKAEETRTGTTALDLDEMAALLAARNPNQLPLLMTPGGGA